MGDTQLLNQKLPLMYTSFQDALVNIQAERNCGLLRPEQMEAFTSESINFDNQIALSMKNRQLMRHLNGLVCTSVHVITMHECTMNETTFLDTAVYNI